MQEAPQNAGSMAGALFGRRENLMTSETAQGRTVVNIVAAESTNGLQ